MRKMSDKIDKYLKFIQTSQLIANSNPPIPQIVPPAKNLEVISLWHQRFNVLIDFGGFLRLASPLTKDHIGDEIRLIVSEISLDAYHTTFLRVLQVEPVTLGNFPVHCFLHPVDVIYHFIPPLFLHRLHCPLVLGIYHPHEQEPCTLQLRHWDVLNGLIVETAVLDGDTTGWLGGGELPWRVHHDDIKLPVADLQLLLQQVLEVKLGDICADRDGIVAHWRFLHQGYKDRLPRFYRSSLRNTCLQYFVRFSTFSSRSRSFSFSSGSLSTMQLSSKMSSSSDDPSDALLSSFLLRPSRSFSSSSDYSQSAEASSYGSNEQSRPYSSSACCIRQLLFKQRSRFLNVQMFQIAVCFNQTICEKSQELQMRQKTGGEREEWEWKGENSQSPRFSRLSEVHEGHLPQVQKLTKIKQNFTPQMTQLSTASSHLFASFGKPTPSVYHSPQHYYESKLVMNSPNPQSSHSSPRDQPSAHLPSKSQAHKSSTRSPEKIQLLQRSQYLFIFLAKAVRVFNSHIIADKLKAFIEIKLKSLIYTEKLCKKILKIFQTKKRMGFHQIHCQSIQALLVKKKTHESEQNQKKMLSKQKKKSNANIGLELREEIVNKQIEPQFPKKEFSEIVQRKSGGKKSSEDQKGKTGYFVRMIQNVDAFNSYGLGEDLQSNRKIQKQMLKMQKNQIYCGSLNNPSEQSNRQIYAESRSSFNIYDSIIVLQPTNNLETVKRLYHLQNDTFKQNCPDTSLVPPQSLQYKKIREDQSFQINHPYDIKNKKKICKYNPLVKNIDSLVDKKLVFDKSDHHYSQESVKVSDSGKQLQIKLRKQDKITPRQQYSSNQYIYPSKAILQNTQKSLRKNCMETPKHRKQRTLKNWPDNIRAASNRKIIQYLPRQPCLKNIISNQSNLKQRTNSGTPLNMTPSPVKSHTERRSTFIGRPKISFTTSSPDSKRKKVQFQTLHRNYQNSPQSKNYQKKSNGRDRIFFQAKQPSTIINRRVSNWQSPQQELRKKPIILQPDYYRFLPLANNPKSSVEKTQNVSGNIRPSRSTSKKKIKVVSHR